MGFFLSFFSVFVLGFWLTMSWFNKCLCRKRLTFQSDSDSEPFSLPSPLPNWPQGQGFASGRINLGELEVSEHTEFEQVLNKNPSRSKNRGVTFYKPARIPERFHCLGHYCQKNNKNRSRGFVLVARELDTHTSEKPRALCSPFDYVLANSPGLNHGFYIWLPRAPEGYKPVGFLVTEKPDKPSLDEMRCVREDLTDECDAYRLLFDCGKLRIFSTRPCHRGITGKGVSVGSFSCSEKISIKCLKNLNFSLEAMPNIDQIHTLIDHYGPTVFFHPKEVYLPSSVQWFFENGALLYRKGLGLGEPIDPRGSNLPTRGTNDGEFWIDLPSDEAQRERVKRGDLESAKLYVHAKPALGGTFVDIAMWIFCPFNGPATLKIGAANYALSKIGGHVCDWEHFTLRISNFTGELRMVYYAQHSGGEWVEPRDLEFLENTNKTVIYSSKNGHASYPRPGTYIQGSSSFGVGIRNDAAKSGLFVDSSKKYELVAAEYLGVSEPCWLQYMRLWGPVIVYDSRTGLDKKIDRLPVKVRGSVRDLFCKLPCEFYGEAGPTGPKEKNYWVEDERG